MVGMYAQFTSLFMAILLQCLGQYYCDGKGSTTAMNKQHAYLGYHFRIFVGNSAIFFRFSGVFCCRQCIMACCLPEKML